jgi:PST family polysaccharide transporter
MVRRSLLATTGLSLAATFVLEVMAGPIIRVFLGVGYEESLSILRLLALVIPLASITGTVGMLWMLPLGLDRRFARITVMAAVVNLCVAAVVVPRFGAEGLAVLVVGIEGLLVLAMVLMLWGKESFFERGRQG